MHSPLVRLFGFALLLTAVSPPGALGRPAEDVPSNLVVDVRVLEARSVSPDFKTMESLAFFVDTDGSGVSERQWLATIARNVPESYLATLAWQTLRVDANAVHLGLEKRSRSFEVTVDLAEFLERGTFNAVVRGELKRGGDPQRSFEETIELRTGQTYVLSGPELELSASEYLSHFRDYDDRDHRREVYDRLRDFAVFLILTITPRLATDTSEPEPVTLALPQDTVLPEFESPLGVELVGTVELEIVIGPDGAPEDVKILRSSIPEVNPRLLGESSKWRFPQPFGTRGRLVLELTARP